MSVSLLKSFSKVANAETKVLILGSIPGRASLNEQQYYAHPQNCFWRLMEDLLQIDRTLPYAIRLAKLQASGYGLWDVIRHCHRASSLDADIVGSSVEVNDFVQFFRAYPNVRSVFFNGTKAEAIFKKQVLPLLSTASNELNFVAMRLPSTSPAHAALDYQAKLAIWSDILLDR